MKIFYFTTTGNSLAVARAIGGELLSVSEAVKSQRQLWTDDEAIGLVCPVYFGALPRPVSHWLERIELTAPYKFLVLTCGNTPSLAVREGHGWDYVASIRMVDNYFPMFDVGKQIRDLLSKHVGWHLSKIAEDIANRVRHRESVTLYGRIAGWCMGLFPLSPEAYRRFYIEPDRCTRCGICERICPIGNITIADLPEIHSGCLTCGACYHNCPSAAIRYRGEKSRVQYRHPTVTLRDLLQN